MHSESSAHATKHRPILGRGREGMSVVAVLIGAALLGVIAFAATRVLPMHHATRAKATRDADVVDLRRYMRESLNCASTLASAPVCDGSTLIEVKTAVGATLIAATGQTVLNTYQLRATCAPGTRELRISYLPVKGTVPDEPATDPVKRAAGATSAEARYEWRDLFGGVPVACPIGCPSMGMTHCAFVVDADGDSAINDDPFGKLPPGPQGSREYYTQRCQAFATAAGLAGTWRALLSLNAAYPIAAADLPFQASGQLDARDYIPITGPVYNIVGQLVAAGAADFWSTAHLAAIAYTQEGFLETGMTITGSHADGRYAIGCPDEATKTCNCRNYGSYDVGGGLRSACGNPSQTNGDWIDFVGVGAYCTMCTLRTDSVRDHPNFMCVRI